MVERFMINYDIRGEQPHPKGDFVHYSDYVELERRVATLPQHGEPVAVRGLECHEISHKDNWPGGISDGLTLPCESCGMVPALDYTVSDEIWQAVVPDESRRSVVCLPCFDQMAADKGIDISEALERVQFVGIGKTVVLKPVAVYWYPSPEPEEK